MDIDWIETLLYGIVSGLTEFLPVSAQAHQLILLNLFGENDTHALMDMFVRLGSLAALLLSSVSLIRRSYREYKLSRVPKRRRKRELNMQSVLDIRFVKMACIPLIAGFFLYPRTMQWNSSLPLVAVFLLLNGIILYIPMYLAKGNKDSRNMSSLDGILFGLGAALSFLPGVSRVGASTSIAAARGADTQQALKWSLILSIPALAGLICFDLYAVMTGSLTGVDLVFILKSVLGGVASYLGTSLSIALIKTITVRSDFSGFSYYSWGAALFTFILYLY